VKGTDCSIERGIVFPVPACEDYLRLSCRANIRKASMRCGCHRRYRRQRMVLERVRYSSSLATLHPRHVDALSAAQARLG
jgi:hypothetical protein